MSKCKCGKEIIDDGLRSYRDGEKVCYECAFPKKKRDYKVKLDCTAPEERIREAKVKRYAKIYSHDSSSGIMQQHKVGKWVLYSEYKSLSIENKALREQVARMKEDTKKIKGLMAFWRELESYDHYDMLRDIEEVLQLAGKEQES